MNKFWGRTDSHESVPKFSRDDDQLLALNYENLCDSEYLNRLFYNDGSTNNSGESISDSDKMFPFYYSSVPEFDPIENYLTTGDLCEDILLFGNNNSFGLDCLKKRSQKELYSMLSMNHDSYSSLIHKQVHIFKHLKFIIADKCKDIGALNSSDIALKKVSLLNNEAKLSRKSIFHTALLSSLQVIKRQSNNSLNTSIVEHMISLYLKLSLRDNDEVDKDKRESAEISSYSSLKLYLTHFHLIFSNGIKNSIESSKNISNLDAETLRECLNLMKICALGYLVTSLQIRCSSYTIFSICHLIAVTQHIKHLENEMLELISKISLEDDVSTSNQVIDPAKLKLITKSAINMSNNCIDNNGYIKIASKSNIYEDEDLNFNSRDNHVIKAPIVTVNSASHMSSNKLVTAGKNKDKISILNMSSSNKSVLLDKEMNNKTRFKMKDEKMKSVNETLLEMKQSDNDYIMQTANSNNPVSMLSIISLPPNTSLIVPTSKSNVIGKSHPQPANDQSVNPKELLLATLRSLQFVPTHVLNTINDFGILQSQTYVVGADITNTLEKSCHIRASRNFQSSVWSCGQNSYSELGHSDIVTRKSFQRITCLDSKQIISLGAGNEHSLFLTKHGKLLSVGFNDSGQCGNGNTSQVKIPTVVAGLVEHEDITQVHSYNGCEHALAITKDGKVYSWGCNLRGQLGLGSSNSEQLPHSIKSLLSYKVVLAACSYHHSYFLCSDGSIWSCGRNDFGQLGLGDTVDRKSPQMVSTTISNARQITCGQYHTGLLTCDNKVYMVGKNDCGQIGIECPGDNFLKIFTRLNSPIIENEVISQVCCGYYHTLLLTTNSLVFGFGRNDSGQLGLGHNQPPKIVSITPISQLRDKNVIALSSGCYHSIATTSNGMLYVFGRNNHGQLGTNDLEEKHSPHPIDEFLGKKILSVSAGFYHTLVVVAENIRKFEDPAKIRNDTDKISKSVKFIDDDDGDDESMDLQFSSCMNATPNSNAIINSPMSHKSQNISLKPLNNVPENQESQLNAQFLISPSSTLTSVADLIAENDLFSNNDEIGYEKNPVLEYFEKLKDGQDSHRNNNRNETNVESTVQKKLSDIIHNNRSDTVSNLYSNLSSISLFDLLSFVCENFGSFQNFDTVIENSSKSNNVQIFQSLNIFSFIFKLCRSIISDNDSKSILNVNQATKLLDGILISVQKFFSKYKDEITLILEKSNQDNDFNANCDVIDKFYFSNSSARSNSFDSPDCHNGCVGVKLHNEEGSDVSLVEESVSKLFNRPDIWDFSSSSIVNEINKFITSDSSSCILVDSNDNVKISKELISSMTTFREELFYVYFYLEASSFLSNTSTVSSLMNTDLSHQDSSSYFSVYSSIYSSVYSSIYMSPRSESSSLLINIIDLTGCIITKNIHSLFPTLTQLTHLFHLLTNQILSNSILSVESNELDQIHENEKLIDYLRLLKLFSMLCFKYRSIKDVIKLFKRSKVHGLIIFQQSFSVYNHLSQISLHYNVNNTLLSSSSNNISSNNNNNKSNLSQLSMLMNEISRILGIIEHCNSNFCKVAIPVTLSFSCINPINDSASSATGNQDQKAFIIQGNIAVIGNRINKEILNSSELVVKYLTHNYHLIDDMASVLKNITVLSTILPTYLLFGISCMVDSYVDSIDKNLLFDIVPDIKSLISALLLLSKLSLEHINPGQKPISTDNSVLNHFLGSNPSALAISHQHTSKKDMISQYTTWWNKLLKLCVVFCLKISSCQFYRRNILKHSSQSTEVSTHSPSNLDTPSSTLIRLLYHNVWLYQSTPLFQSYYNCISNPTFKMDLFSAFLSSDSFKIGVVWNQNLRELSMKTDVGYRLIMTSAKATGALDHIVKIEDLVFCFVLYQILGSTVSLYNSQWFYQNYNASSATTNVFRKIRSSIVAFVKHIHSKRSELLSKNTTGLTWIQLIDQFLKYIQKIVFYLLFQENGVIFNKFNQTLTLPFRSSGNLSNGKKLWRKVIAVVIGLYRWKKHLHHRTSNHGLYSIDFIVESLDFLSVSFTESTDQIWNDSWLLLLNEINNEEIASNRLITGISLFSTVLTDCNISSAKSDALAMLINSLTNRRLFTCSTKSSRADAESQSTQKSLLSLNIPNQLFIKQKQAIKSLIASIMQIIQDFVKSHPTNCQFVKLSDLTLLQSAVNVLRQLFMYSKEDVFRLLCIDVGLLFQLILLLDEKSNSDLHSVISEITEIASFNTSFSEDFSTPSGYRIFSLIGNEPNICSLNSSLLSVFRQPLANSDNSTPSSKFLGPASAVNPRKTTNNKSREKLKAINRALNSIVSFLGDILIYSQKDRFPDALIFSFWLLGYFQVGRLVTQNKNCQEIDNSHGGSNQENGLSLNQSSANTFSFLSIATNHNGGFGGNKQSSNLSTAQGQQAKIQQKKSKQDIISKPIEFCQVQEGIQVPTEQFSNSSKSSDFTLDVWLYLTKKTSNKSHTFITGKIFQNDVWPCVLLTQDMKLEVIFGHTNDLERMISKITIPCLQWVHVAVVVEHKKIKLYLNGQPDVHKMTNKANIRAMSYPIVIGTCASLAKPKIEYLMNGFDGVIGSYKYHNRSLSSLHVKLVYDQGPPEMDNREKWVYKLLAASNTAYSSFYSQNSSDVLQKQEFHSYAVNILLMIMITELTSSRLRLSAITVLGKFMTASNFCLDNITLPHNTSFLSTNQAGIQNSPRPQNFSSILLSECSFLQEYETLREKFICYLIRILGACISPHLVYASEVDDFSMTDFDSKSPFPFETENDYKQFKDFMAYVPCVLLNKSSTSRSTNSSSCPSASGSSVESSSLTKSSKIVISYDKSADRNETVQELIFHLSHLLKLLSVQSGWVDSFTSVLSKMSSRTSQIFVSNSPLLSAERISKSSSHPWTSLARLDVLGLMSFFGGYNTNICAGIDVRTKYNEDISRVLNVNKLNGSVSVLSKNSNFQRNAIYVLDEVDVDACDTVEDNSEFNHEHKYSFLTEGILVQLFDIMRLLQNQVRLVLHDGLYYPSSMITDSKSIYDSAASPSYLFVKHVMVKFIRPMETFYFHQMVSFIHQLVYHSSTQKLVSKVISLYPDIYSFFTMSSIAIARLYAHIPTKSTTNVSNTKKTVMHSQKNCSNMHFYPYSTNLKQNLVPVTSLLTDNSKYLVNVPERTQAVNTFIDSENDRLLAYFYNKTLNVALSTNLSLYSSHLSQSKTSVGNSLSMLAGFSSQINSPAANVISSQTSPSFAQITSQLSNISEKLLKRGYFNEYIVSCSKDKEVYSDSFASTACLTLDEQYFVSNWSLSNTQIGNLSSPNSSSEMSSAKFSLYGKGFSAMLYNSISSNVTNESPLSVHTTATVVPISPSNLAASSSSLSLESVKKAAIVSTTPSSPKPVEVIGTSTNFFPSVDYKSFVNELTNENYADLIQLVSNMRHNIIIYSRAIIQALPLPSVLNVKPSNTRSDNSKQYLKSNTDSVDEDTLEVYRLNNCSISRLFLLWQSLHHYISTGPDSSESSSYQQLLSYFVDSSQTSQIPLQFIKIFNHQLQFMLFKLLDNFNLTSSLSSPSSLNISNNSNVSSSSGAGNILDNSDMFVRVIYSVYEWLKVYEFDSGVASHSKSSGLDSNCKLGILRELQILCECIRTFMTNVMCFVDTLVAIEPYVMMIVRLCRFILKRIYYLLVISSNSGKAMVPLNQSMSLLLQPENSNTQNNLMLKNSLINQKDRPASYLSISSLIKQVTSQVFTGLRARSTELLSKEKGHIHVDSKLMDGTMTFAYQLAQLMAGLEVIQRTCVHFPLVKSVYSNIYNHLYSDLSSNSVTGIALSSNSIKAVTDSNKRSESSSLDPMLILSHISLILSKIPSSSDISSSSTRRKSVLTSESLLPQMSPQVNLKSVSDKGVSNTPQYIVKGISGLNNTITGSLCVSIETSVPKISEVKSTSIYIDMSDIYTDLIDRISSLYLLSLDNPLSSPLSENSRSAANLDNPIISPLRPLTPRLTSRPSTPSSTKIPLSATPRTGSSVGLPLLPRLSSAELATVVKSLSDYMVVEIALATFSGDDVAPIYETVYCGYTVTFVHSGLTPSCKYVVKIRAIIGGYSCQWSVPTTFTTLPGVLFTFDPIQSGPDITITSNGLVAKYNNDDNWSIVLGSHGFSAGVTSWDIKIVNSSSAYLFIGIASALTELNTFLGGDIYSYGYIGEQAIYHNREKVKIYGEAFGNGDVISVILDLNEGTLAYSKNGHYLGIAFDNIFGEYFPAVAFYSLHQELELLPSSFKSALPQEVVPCSLSALNLNQISNLMELIFCIQTKTSFSYRALQYIASSLEEWSSQQVVRTKCITGKYVYLLLSSFLLTKHSFVINERIRTPRGVAQVAGVAYNRIWFRFLPTNSVWYFTEEEIIRGKQQGFFLRCTYMLTSSKSTSTKNIIDGRMPTVKEVMTTPRSPNRGHDTSGLPEYTPIRTLGSNHSDTDTGNASRTSAAQSILSFDPLTLPELINSINWSNEMDAVLVNALLNKANLHGITPWNIPTYFILDDFRSIQKTLSKLILKDTTLSHHWGISGPKRRAVIARLGVLRLLNHLLEPYLSVLLQDELGFDERDNLWYSLQRSTYCNQLFCKPSSSGVFTKQSKSSKDESAYPTILSLPAARDYNSSRNSVEAEDSDDGFNSACDDSPSPFLISTSWNPIPMSILLSLDSISCVRNHLFNELKMKHFWDIVTRSTGQPAKTEDDYDYPEDLPQISINRLSSFRIREASQLFVIPGEDLYLSTIFCQLWKELRRYPQEKLRISYMHPMDDGQTRTFKVKFDGFGVDDYGGPYREVLQQICDELQYLDQSKPIEVTSEYLCFIPLLLPTPNYQNYMNNNINEMTIENYGGKFIFNPSSISAVKLDLFRFLGQVIGISIRSRVTLTLSFPSFIWKCAVKEILTEEDINSFDCNSFQYVKQFRNLLVKKKSCLDILNQQNLSGTAFKEQNDKLLEAVSDNMKSLDFQTDCTPIKSMDEIQLKRKNSSKGSNVLSEVELELQQLDNEINELLQDVTWSMTRSDGQIVDLSPSGRHKSVSASDLELYLQKYVECKLNESKHQLLWFRDGLHSVIPSISLSLLTWQELEIIVCGYSHSSSNLDMNGSVDGVNSTTNQFSTDMRRLQANTEYDDDVSATDSHIVNFWDVVINDFNELEKQSFLRFVWARSTLPPVGSEFMQKFKIQSAVGDDAVLKPDQYLPKAHTCFFSLNLPRYTTKEILTEKLRYAISNCSEMDADFRLTDTNVVGWGSGLPQGNMNTSFNDDY